MSDYDTRLSMTHLAQNIFPQSLQWCLRSVNVNSALHCIQLSTASSFSQCSITLPVCGGEGGKRQVHMCTYVLACANAYG